MRFNSQRDGILPEACRIAAGSAEFQFPTGWNSTPRHLSGFLAEHCFNSQRDGILLSKRIAYLRDHTSFNSQRDGILHCIFTFTDYLFVFQFPTGWNSTRDCKRNHPARRLGFNSQRDGILRLHALHSGHLHRFQFPTGWNSTNTSKERGYERKLFQFPTGWNSTFF